MSQGNGQLFGLNLSEWATQSGLTPIGAYSITGHAVKALQDLTSLSTDDIDYLMWYYLAVTAAVGASTLGISDLVNIWDGSFGPVTNSFLLLETGDYLLLETGDKLILES